MFTRYGLMSRLIGLGGIDPYVQAANAKGSFSVNGRLQSRGSVQHDRRTCSVPVLSKD